MEPGPGSVADVGTLVADRYCLERVLGSGGMGTVWLAWDTILERRCALKLVDPTKASNEEVRARFRREARAAARIRCDNVVDVFDHGDWNGIPFIVMEFLEGEDLYTRLSRCGRLEAQETYELVVQVARALVRAHAVGIVHRDIKPENIFLVPGDEHEIAKVLDFGIARQNVCRLEDRNTRVGQLLGTPYYMSPEQVRGQEADWRSDLWALGVIAFQCLTGRLPFESEALGELMAAILYDRIPLPSDFVPSLPSAVDRWWEKAAHRDPELRYQSAKQLADGLGDALGFPRLPVPSLVPPRPGAMDWSAEPSSPGMAALRAPTLPASALATAEVFDPSVPYWSDESNTGAPVSHTRRSLLPQIGELENWQLGLAVGTVVLVVAGIAGGLAWRPASKAEVAASVREQSIHEVEVRPAAAAPAASEAKPVPTSSQRPPSLSRWEDLRPEPVSSGLRPSRERRPGPLPRVAPATPKKKATVPDYGI